MKNFSKLFVALIFLSFVSCETSELESNSERESDPKDPKEITKCETAFGSSDYCFSEDGFNRWGWVIGPLVEMEEKTEHEIWAAAGRCDRDNGTLVGYLYVDYNEGVATITYDAELGYLFSETHLYVGNEMYPLLRNGRPTVAPGQYPYSEATDGPAGVVTYVIEDLRDEIYVIAHSVSCPGKKDDKEDDDIPN